MSDDYVLRGFNHNGREIEYCFYSACHKLIRNALRKLCRNTDYGKLGI